MIWPESPPFSLSSSCVMFLLMAPVRGTLVFLPSLTLTRFIHVISLCTYCSPCPFFSYLLVHFHSCFRPLSKCHILGPLMRWKPICTLPSGNICPDYAFAFGSLKINGQAILPLLQAPQGRDKSDFHCPASPASSMVSARRGSWDNQPCTPVETVGAEARVPRFKPYLCHLLTWDLEQAIWFLYTSHLSNEDGNMCTTFLKGLLWGLNELMWAKCLEWDQLETQPGFQ